MKRFLVVLLMLLTVLFVFADDALVLPEGVMRLTLADSLINGDQAYDDDGKADDSQEFAFNNFGAAIEFGITDTLTAAFQWAPGVMLAGEASNTELAMYSGFGVNEDDLVFTGIADLFVGAKYQLIKTDDIRFAAALGLQVPLDSIDGEEEATNITNGDEFRSSSQSDTESLGIGCRLYFDYIFSDSFYINLYNQTRYFLPNTVENGVAYYLTSGTAYESDMEYGIRTEFELEPHYIIKFASKSNVEIFAPVKYDFSAADTEDDSKGDDSYVLSVAPGASIFMAESIPFQLSAEYKIPLMGRNDSLTNVLTIQLKLFYDFY